MIKSCYYHDIARGTYKVEKGYKLPKKVVKKIKMEMSYILFLNKLKMRKKLPMLCSIF